MVPAARLILLLGAGLGLLAGLTAALLCLGLFPSADSPVALTLAQAHGILMTYGFVGTAVGLERAVAVQSSGTMRARLAYIVPVSSGIAVLLTLLAAAGMQQPDGVPVRLLPGAAWALSMAALACIYVLLYRRGPAPAILIQLLGSVVGLAGILLWTRGFEIAAIFPWWAAFLILTIVGERVELARIAFLRPGLERRILAESLVLLLALVIALYRPAIGYPIMGIALGTLILDVAWHDIARRTIHAGGVTRLMAACMLSGYAWLAIPVATWILVGPVYSGYPYDAVVHAITIGFILSMIMAHAPVIVPAIVRREVPYHPAMWAVWALIQLSLVIRLVAGARGAESPWQFGGALGVAAALSFIAVTASLVGRGSGTGSDQKSAQESSGGPA